MTDTSRPHIGEKITLPQTPQHNANTYTITDVTEVEGRWYIRVFGLIMTIDWTALQTIPEPTEE